MGAFHGERPHHAWLLAGPRGVGKAVFAATVARWLLARAADPLAPLPADLAHDHPTARLFDAGTHPDLRVLKRSLKDVGKPSERLVRNITVDQIRSMQSVLHSRPSFSDRRVVLIDSADDLEGGGANALLKSLEEPPAGAVFLLISHAPGRLLPTIRSRCRTLPLDPLDGGDVRSVLKAQGVPADSIDALVASADGSPGVAIAGHALDLAGLDAALERIARSGDPRLADRQRIARSVSGRAGADRFDLLTQRVPRLLRRIAAQEAGERRGRALEAYTAARSFGSSARRLGLDQSGAAVRLTGWLAELAPGAASPQG